MMILALLLTFNPGTYSQPAGFPCAEITGGSVTITLIGEGVVNDIGVPVVQIGDPPTLRAFDPSFVLGGGGGYTQTSNPLIGSATVADHALVSLKTTGYVIVKLDLQGTPRPWDLDCDGTVGVVDLMILLAAWGKPYDVSDLLALLSAWSN